MTDIDDASSSRDDAADGSTTPLWSVYRADDNGNRFLVVSDLPEAQAEQRARQMESLGHKQTYWIEPAVPKRASR